MNHVKSKIRTLKFDNHIWEFGYFGEDKNSFSAYGFRQDGTVIRVLSEYETNLICHAFIKSGAVLA